MVLDNIARMIAMHWIAKDCTRVARKHGLENYKAEAKRVV
jgi:hypothetical protein